MAERVALPVLDLLGTALRDVFGHLGGLVRIAWIYFALAAAILALGLWLSSGSGAVAALAPLFGPATAYLVIVLGGLACTVKWQRHVILGEVLDRTAPLDGRATRYGLWGLAVGFLALLPGVAALALGLVTGLVAANPDGDPPFHVYPTGILLGVVAVVLMAVVWSRFLLLFPAVSADDPQIRLRGSWRLAGGNALRILAALIVLALGMSLVGAALGLIQTAIESAASSAPPGERSILGWSLELALQSAVNLIASTATASLTADAYRRLRRR